MFVYVTDALLAPSKSVTSYKSLALSPDAVETTSDVAERFALTSGSTIIFKFVVNGDDVCPLLIVSVVV